MEGIYGIFFESLIRSIPITPSVHPPSCIALTELRQSSDRGQSSDYRSFMRAPNTSLSTFRIGILTHRLWSCVGAVVLVALWAALGLRRESVYSGCLIGVCSLSDESGGEPSLLVSVRPR
jgi:hypothetical protein